MSLGGWGGGNSSSCRLLVVLDTAALNVARITQSSIPASVSVLPIPELRANNATHVVRNPEMRLASPPPASFNQTPRSAVRRGKKEKAATCSDSTIIAVP